MRAFTRIHGAAVFGAEARLVDVQVAVDANEEVDRGSFRIVGLPDSALREGRERIRSAVHHAGWPWYARWVLVNLAPAALKKEGAALDLPIALGILGAMGVLGPAARSANDGDSARTSLDRWMCLGELSLDGSVRGVRGVLAAAEAARRSGIEQMLVPRANAAEAAAVGALVIAVDTLAEAAGHLAGQAPLPPFEGAPWTPGAWGGERPSPVRGQPVAVRAAWIAATGGHNLLLSGPPGSGKTLLARHMRDVLPPLTFDEAIMASRVGSVAGLLDGGILQQRPFRAPHHSASLPGLVGGGTVPGPGEVSLAHGGLLFLDELAEFARGTLEALRQPIEDGSLTICRASGRVRLPSRVWLVAATNPCPCGWKGVGERCRCSAAEVSRYRARISGPLRDRFDLHVEVRPVDPARLVGEPEGSPFAAEAVRGAWDAQRARAARLGLSRPWNAGLPPGLLPKAADLTAEANRTLVSSARAMGLSARGMHRCVRVARTVADLDAQQRVEAPHVAQALALRAETS